MPENAKETLVKAWPWIALVFGVLQLLAAWGLWQLTRFVESLNNLVLYTAAKPITGFDKTLIYLGVLVLVVDGIILLLAYPHLKLRNHKGWELLFLGALLNVVYGVVELFINGRGIGSFVFSLIGSAVGFYLLFQVRDKYNGIAPRVPKSAG
ncbi:hypothetical protein HY218_00925 [Candidatus Saccharibacteria bacterium]|nr:hypothetical protein [Candidatus Saccharibacteria bacterium]